MDGLDLCTTQQRERELCLAAHKAYLHGLRQQVHGLPDGDGEVTEGDSGSASGHASTASTSSSASAAASASYAFLRSLFSGSVNSSSRSGGLFIRCVSAPHGGNGNGTVGMAACGPDGAEEGEGLVPRHLSETHHTLLTPKR